MVMVIGNKHPLIMFFVMTALAAGSCSDAPKEKSKNAASSPSPTPSSDGTAKSLTDCNSKKLAWIPVVDDDDSPATCGATLAAFCCSREEILKRFPSRKNELGKIFAQSVDTDGYKVYNCSKPDAKTTIIHYAIIDAAAGKTRYKTTQIDNLAETETNFKGTCPSVTAEDMIVGQAGKTPDSGTAILFTDINAILTASCNGSGCHGTGASFGEYVGNEANFKGDKTEITERIGRAAGASGVMPPTKANLSDANREKIVKFLNPPPATAIAFTAVNSILKASCDGSGCHGTGSTNGAYVDNDANFKSFKDDIIERIGRAAGASGVMPPTKSALSDANNATLIRYLNQ